MSNALDRYIAKADLTDPKNRVEYANALTETAAATNSGGFNDYTFLQFSGKRGMWSLSSAAGSAPYTFTDNEMCIVLPEQFTEGWIFWAGGIAKDRKQWYVANRATEGIEREHLPEHTIPIYIDPKTGEQVPSIADGWHRQIGMSMFLAFKDSIEGSQRMLIFSTNSISGRNAVAVLMREIGERIHKNEPCYPAITLGIESFTAKGKQNYKPMFSVHSWLTQEEVVSAFSNYNLEGTQEAEYEEVVTEATPPPPTTKSVKTAPAPIKSANTPSNIPEFLRV